MAEIVTEKPKTYIASPSGFAESTKHWYNGIFIPCVSKYVEPLDPWKVNVDHILSAPPQERPELWTDLGDYHYKTIAQKAKLLIAILDQEPPDTGTVCEVAWAAAHDIPVIGYRSDIRTGGEEGLPYNLMLVAAIRKNGGVAVSSLVDLEVELQTRFPNQSATE